MKKFLDENFLLQSKTAQRLYHEFAKSMPVIDYHNHLPPDQIANDINFENITQAWLYGDHYKWRTMRTNGFEEKYITGNASNWEKFRQWSVTVPYALRNPLYHWTHLELQRYFNVHDILNGDTAERIYDECSAKLQTKEYSVKRLLEKMNVRVVCTTDDPVDSLEYHQKIKADNWKIKVLPAFRPDKPVSKSLELPNHPELRADYFLERREIGIINVGADGIVIADRKEFTLRKLDCVYLGKVTRIVKFKSKSKKSSYFLSALFACSSQVSKQTDGKRKATPVQLGAAETANKRTVYKYIHLDGIRSCQLVMGLTILELGSVWNSIPPHTHTRRMEVYFYFDLADQHRIFHFMGEPQQTRHIVMSNQEAVISPPWSTYSLWMRYK